jgi:hypothetical protein
MKELRTRYTKQSKRKPALTRQAFLDDLIYEAIEDPYHFDNIDEAVAYLSSKYKLALDELAYLKKKAESDPVIKLRIKKIK